MTLRRLSQNMLSYVLLCLFGLVFIWPILFLVIGGFKPDEQVLADAGGIRSLLPTHMSWQNYIDVFGRVPFSRYMLNSLWITGCIVAAGLVVNAMAGYALARLQWPGRRAALMLVLAVMIIPIEAIAVPLFYQVSVLGWRDTYTVQIVPFIANAFSVYLFYTFFLSLPKEFEEAAYLDGAGVFRSFFWIIVPNSKPVFATVTILTFLLQWGAFLWPLMVTIGEQVRPLPLAIATFHDLPPLQWGDIFAFGTMMVAPIVVVFFVFQRWFVRGVAATGMKG